MPGSFDRPLATGDTLGILGGGQLGRMLAIAAARLGLRTIVLDPDSDCPAGQVATQVICATFDDAKSLKRFAGSCDRATYEFENIPVAAIETISHETPVAPGKAAIETSQDRLLEKQFLARLEIDTARFREIGTVQDLEIALPDFAESILKTRRYGYDGKGQLRLSGAAGLPDDIAATLEQPCILEELVDFSLEISVIAARSTNGSVVVYDPVWNEHRDGILRKSVVPAPVSKKIANSAAGHTERILDALNYVGVIGVEFFVTRDDRLLVNEFAPRVHNSGHWTEAACLVSQFENHVRAVCSMPLAEPARHSDCEMRNLIGDEVNRVGELLAAPGSLLHLYGKRETRPGRKMGHLTRIWPRTDAGRSARIPTQ